MKRSHEIVPRLMLLCAAFFVPARRRRAWLQDWTSELWYVLEASHTRSESLFRRQSAAIAFCAGAFRDAWCLWCEPSAMSTLAETSATKSVWRCALLLSLAAIVTSTLALLLPGVRSSVLPSPYRDSRSLVLLSRTDLSEQLPSIRMRQVRLWQGLGQHLFSEFAFYEPTVKPLLIGSRYTSGLHIARATANLFPLLGGSLAGAEVTEPTLFVSDAVWQQQFHSDSRLLHTIVKVGIHKVRLAGVLPRDQWRLPGKFDAWLLEPARSSAIPGSAQGVVVARLLPSAENLERGEQWKISSRRPDGDIAYFQCTALSIRDRNPQRLFLFALLLALLALPATTSLPLGEYPVSGANISWSLRVRRWMFLTVKFGLLVPTLCFGALDLAYAFPIAPTSSQYIQLSVSFLFGLFGFRWILRDQRRRCPVCLSTLTNPARVGEPSRNFLGWNGTELICAGGHGLLHVPELPTSWFGTQRWLYLDSSWSSLFLGTI